MSKVHKQTIPRARQSLHACTLAGNRVLGKNYNLGRKLAYGYSWSQF